MTERIRGVLAPVVTPFKADLAPDLERLIAQIRFDVFVGAESFLLACMRNGSAGSMSVFSRRSLAMLVSLGGCLAGSRPTKDR
jgi:4-hydroxy-tetrahydrodipicolinate synthase